MPIMENRTNDLRQSLAKEKREASIAVILDRGLVKPKTATELIREIWGNLGLRFIFWDTSYSIIFGALTLMPLLLLAILVPENMRYTTAFAVAPMLFLIIIAFAETAEKVSGLYELKQICRYTVWQLAALRVIFYSLAGILYSIIVTLISAGNAFELISLLLLCLSSLFACAALSLFALRHFRWKWGALIFAAIWAFANLTLPYTIGTAWEAFLAEIPIAITAAVAAIGAAALAIQVRKMLMEVRNYAVA
jgi:hypothetical protein